MNVDLNSKLYYSYKQYVTSCLFDNFHYYRLNSLHFKYRFTHVFINYLSRYLNDDFISFLLIQYVLLSIQLTLLHSLCKQYKNLSFLTLSETSHFYYLKTQLPQSNFVKYSIIVISQLKASLSQLILCDLILIVLITITNC